MHSKWPARAAVAGLAVTLAAGFAAGTAAGTAARLAARLAPGTASAKRMSDGPKAGDSTLPTEKFHFYQRNRCDLIYDNAPPEYP